MGSGTILWRCPSFERSRLPAAVVFLLYSLRAELTAVSTLTMRPDAIDAIQKLEKVVAVLLDPAASPTSPAFRPSTRWEWQQAQSESLHGEKHGSARVEAAPNDEGSLKSRDFRVHPET